MVLGVLLLAWGIISVINCLFQNEYSKLLEGNAYSFVYVMTMVIIQALLIYGGIKCINKAKRKKQSNSNKEENK